MSADPKSALDHVNDTLLQLKEMRHYSKNNVELLADNLMPYALTNHVHEREVSVQLGVAVEFMPHVAPHFRGITLTANLWLNRAQTREQRFSLDAGDRRLREG